MNYSIIEYTAHGTECTVYTTATYADALDEWEAYCIISNTTNTIIKE